MLDNRDRIIRATLDGKRPSREEALSLAGFSELPVLLETASQLRDHGHGNLISYSKNVFIPFLGKTIYIMPFYAFSYTKIE